MRCIDPETSEAFVVCGEPLRWFVDPQKKSYKGHALLLIPKEDECCRENNDNYACVFLDDDEVAHTCIGTCDQVSNIEVLLIDGRKIDHAELFEENFPDTLKFKLTNWDDC